VPRRDLDGPPLDARRGFPTQDPSAHFDKEFTSEKACDSVVTSKLTEEQAAAANFQGFNYGSK